MNYKELLAKYIAYIVDVEGTDYIDIHDNRYMSDVDFSDSEWRELENISLKRIEQSFE